MADTLTNPMHVEVISPDGPIYQETGVEMVVARAADGEFAVMKNHLPLAAALEMCPVRIIKGGKEQKVAVFGGFLEIKDNQVNIVAPLAELADTIDIAPCPSREETCGRQACVQEQRNRCRPCQTRSPACADTAQNDRNPLIQTKEPIHTNNGSVFMLGEDVKKIKAISCELSAASH